MPRYRAPDLRQRPRKTCPDCGYKIKTTKAGTITRHKTGKENPAMPYCESDNN